MSFLSCAFSSNLTGSWFNFVLHDCLIISRPNILRHQFTDWRVLISCNLLPCSKGLLVQFRCRGPANPTIHGIHSCVKMDSCIWHLLQTLMSKLGYHYRVVHHTFLSLSHVWHAQPTNFGVKLLLPSRKDQSNNVDRERIWQLIQTKYIGFFTVIWGWVLGREYWSEARVKKLEYNKYDND